MATWFTAPEEGEELDRLLNAWDDAPVERLEVLQMLLQVSREQVIAYAPTPVDPARRVAELLDTLGYDVAAIAAVLAVLTLETPEVGPPTRYVLAQLMQARNLWEAGRVSSGGDIGEGGFVFTPRPMDKTIKQIIRPADGTPHVL